MIEKDAEVISRLLSQKDDEIERLRAALVQIRHVCIDNAPSKCDKEMALNFVRSVVEDTLRDGASPVEANQPPARVEGK